MIALSISFQSIFTQNPVSTNLNYNCQGARPNKNWFRSTHPTEKVWQLILIDQYLLFNIKYHVVPNCGTANEINGVLHHDIALSMETRLKQKLTSNFIFFHWSAPNPSENMMIVYLPTIWVFTWYDSMSRDCHMTTFSSKSSLLCRSWHVSNPAETRVKVLFRLFILCSNREIIAKYWSYYKCPWLKYRSALYLLLMMICWAMNTRYLLKINTVILNVSSTSFLVKRVSELVTGIFCILKQFTHNIWRLKCLEILIPTKFKWTFSRQISDTLSYSSTKQHAQLVILFGFCIFKWSRQSPKHLNKGYWTQWSCPSFWYSSLRTQWVTQTSQQSSHHQLSLYENLDENKFWSFVPEVHRDNIFVL